MSYDVYFWWRAVGHPDDVADDISKGDLDAVSRHEAVAALRGSLLASYPDLEDVVEPASDEVDLHDAFLVLTLPFDRSAVADEAIALARARGLQFYDPQTGNAASTGEPDDAPAVGLRSQSGTIRAERTWSRPEIATAAELGSRRLKRAWDFLDLPATVPFGYALASVVFALALSDGATIERGHAMLLARRIADRATGRGVPVAGSVLIDFVSVDLESLARALSEALP